MFLHSYCMNCILELTDLLTSSINTTQTVEDSSGFNLMMDQDTKCTSAFKLPSFKLTSCSICVLSSNSVHLYE